VPGRKEGERGPDIITIKQAAHGLGVSEPTLPTGDTFGFPARRHAIKRSRLDDAPAALQLGAQITALGNRAA
jgi:hypothetical protein